MKSKPEYRHIFTSPSMFYRALHTISTQKYRMPVRRYIFDLFNVDLDADFVRKLSDCAISLRAPRAQDAIGPSPVVEQPQTPLPAPAQNATQPQPQPQPEAPTQAPAKQRQASRERHQRAKQRETVHFRAAVRHHSSESEEEESDVEELRE